MERVKMLTSLLHPIRNFATAVFILLPYSLALAENPLNPPFSKGGIFLDAASRLASLPLFGKVWKRGGRGDLLMISRKRLHRIGNTGLINAIKFLGFSRRLKNDLFVLTHSELFPDRQEHIDMLSVRRAMRFPVRKIIPRESEIFDPEFTHTCRMAAAEIGEQTVVLI